MMVAFFAFHSSTTAMGLLSFFLSVESFFPPPCEAWLKSKHTLLHYMQDMEYAVDWHDTGVFTCLFFNENMLLAWKLDMPCKFPWISTAYWLKYPEDP